MPRGRGDSECLPHRTSRETSWTPECQVRPDREEHEAVLPLADGRGDPTVCHTLNQHRGVQGRDDQPCPVVATSSCLAGTKKSTGASHGLHACDRIWAPEGTQESQKGFVPTERWESHFSGQAPPEESAWARLRPKPGQRGRLDLPLTSPGLFKSCRHVRVCGSSIRGDRGETVPGHARGQMSLCRFMWRRRGREHTQAKTLATAGRHGRSEPGYRRKHTCPTWEEPERARAPRPALRFQ